MATNPGVDKQLRFNVRISTPPRGQDCSAGAGSTYLHRLKPGDKVTAIGPFGDFHIKPSGKEMVYLGGGAGMAPLRSHLAHLFETEKTGRRVSFWYGASLVAGELLPGLLREPGQAIPQLQLPPCAVRASARGQLAILHRLHPRGFAENYLASHPDPTSIEYYVCGPPAMVQAALKMLAGLKVDRSQIAFDEF